MNEAQSYAVVLEGVEKISNLLVRYEIHERLYLGANREATKHLEGLLVGLYVLVLSFLAKAKRFYTKSSASKCSLNNYHPRIAKADMHIRACSRKRRSSLQQIPRVTRQNQSTTGAG